jgi:DNA-binding HxlR family transcriptional regulator
MRHKVNRRLDTDCGIEVALELIGGKWKGIILYRLLGGQLRFNQLQRILPNVTQRMLTKQLRELEQDGLVQRTVYPQVPPRVEYNLTERSQSLAPLLMQLKNWGDTQLQQLQQ